MVCPPDLRRGVFTTAAMDRNIHRNPTSATANSFVCVTNMSMFQYPATDNEGEKNEPLHLGDKKAKTVQERPDS